MAGSGSIPLPRELRTLAREGLLGSALSPGPGSPAPPQGPPRIPPPPASKGPVAAWPRGGSASTHPGPCSPPSPTPAAPRDAGPGSPSPLGKLEHGQILEPGKGTPTLPAHSPYTSLSAPCPVLPTLLPRAPRVSSQRAGARTTHWVFLVGFLVVFSFQ